MKEDTEDFKCGDSFLGWFEVPFSEGTHVLSVIGRSTAWGLRVESLLCEASRVGHLLALSYFKGPAHSPSPVKSANSHWHVTGRGRHRCPSYCVVQCGVRSVDSATCDRVRVPVRLLFIQKSIPEDSASSRCLQEMEDLVSKHASVKRARCVGLIGLSTVGCKEICRCLASAIGPLTLEAAWISRLHPARHWFQGVSLQSYSMLQFE